LDGTRRAKQPMTDVHRDVGAYEYVASGARAEDLPAALEHANLPTLLLVLAHLTGEDAWLEPPFTPGPQRGPGDHDTAGLPDSLQSEVRERAFEMLVGLREGSLTPAPPPTPERLEALLSQSLGEQVPAGCGLLLAEELGIQSRSVPLPRDKVADGFSVVVIGAGVSGILAGRELSGAGVDFTIIEKNPAVGGTWFENQYPGCGVDTPTHLYSFSFAQRAGWSRYFAKRDELFEYTQQVAAEHALGEHIRYGTEVLGATWEEDSQRWRVEVRGANGEREELWANVLISGVGFFNRPAYPKIPGLETFAGPVVHTARWDPELDLRDKRVAVIGNGASAMQLVPAIADVTSHLTIFQRSPQWALPHPNYMRDVSSQTRLLMAEVPHYLAWYRLRLLWNFGDRLHRHVQRDPEWPHQDRSINAANDRQRAFLTDYIRDELGDRTDLLDKCVPVYPPYGKRPLLDNGWFRTVARDDVDLITDAVAEIRPDAVVTAAGDVFPVDVLVLATGFQPQRMLAPMEIRGRSGTTLRDVWGDDDPRAYLGITVPAFPNLFCLLGPNTFAGHGGSGILTIELEMRYVMETLAQMLERDLASVEVRRDVHDAYNAELDHALEQTIWAYPGMTTYYRNSRGRIVVPMPWTNVDYWHRTRSPNLTEYVTVHR